MFPDDCGIYRTVRNSLNQLLLNDTLCAIADPRERWQTVINYSKTCVLTIKHMKSPVDFKYHVENRGIESVREVKYLALTFYAKLYWNAHLYDICAKVYKKLHFLKEKLGACDWTVNLSDYKTAIRPVLEYASIVWDSYLK